MKESIVISATKTKRDIKLNVLVNKKVLQTLWLHPEDPRLEFLTPRSKCYLVEEEAAPISDIKRKAQEKLGKVEKPRYDIIPACFIDVEPAPKKRRAAKKGGSK